MVPFFFKQWGGNTPKAGGHLLDGMVHHAFPAPVRRSPVTHVGQLTPLDHAPVLRAGSA